MPQPSPVDDSPDFPHETDVAIIGGGIAGIATALELAERGIAVAVFEKGDVACEQSSRNWGWCRQMGRDPAELPLIKISMDLWRGMHARLGEDIGFRETGIAYLCETERKFQWRKKWFESYAGVHGLSTKLISPEQAAAFTPGSKVDWKGGLYTFNDGRAEPTLAVPTMARFAQKAGTQIFQNCAVRGIDREAGRLSGLVTERGRVRCKQVVLAGGAWSRRFCHNEGVFLPQLTVVNSVTRTEPLETEISTAIAGCDFAIRKRLDGGYNVGHSTLSMADILPDSFRLLPNFWRLAKEEWRDYRFRIGERSIQELRLERRWRNDEISPFEQVRVLDPKPVASIQREALASLKQTLPAFRDAQIAEIWAGVIDVTPDLVPVISAVDQLPGFYMATGFSGHGFGLGPGAGKLMAEILCGETPCVDPSPFRFSRFQ